MGNVARLIEQRLYADNIYTYLSNIDKETEYKGRYMAMELMEEIRMFKYRMYSKVKWRVKDEIEL